MTRERKAQAVTILVLSGGLAIAMLRDGRWQGLRFGSALSQEAGRNEAGPQDVIYGMLDAARSGDVKGYLSSYTGRVEASLRQTLAESTEAAFARYLTESNAAVKGVALSDPQPLNDREVKVRVEYVYQDRNEAQTLYLEKGPGGWKITRVDSSERVPTLVPYGTPVE